MGHWFHQDVNLVGDWTLSFLILVTWVAVGLAAARILFGRLHKWFSKTSFQFENMLLKSLPAPTYVLVVVTGFMAALHYSPFLKGDMEDVVLALRIALLLTGVYLADNVLVGLLKDIEKRHEDVRNSHFVFSAVIHVAVWVIGAMMVLESLGVNITPLLASLGVGSLAVALALQSTLSNVFSGVHLLIDKPISMGQFVKLPTGEEGYVEMIGWRSTRIRMLNNNTIVVPNSKLAENQILNYHLPETECAVLVQVGVDYASDLSQVEKVTVEVARNIQKTVEGAIETFEPFIRYHDFAESSINFTVILRAKDYVSNYLITHEFIKALHGRYRNEKIVFPFPQRTVEIKGGLPKGS